MLKEAVRGLDTHRRTADEVYCLQYTHLIKALIYYQELCNNS